MEKFNAANLVSLTLAFVLSSAASWVSASGYAGHPVALKLIETMVAERGIPRAELLSLLAQAERQESILKAISRPAEKTKPWHEYRDIFVTDERAVQGVEFYNLYAASLQRAEREYGVPAAIIVAVIGVETRYGRNKGSYRVIDALTTLAFDYPRRSDFFSKELDHFIVLCREQGLPATELRGSYAGAMGYGQFMPSSYRSYAVDFDADGVTDIWNNPVDAIGSVANYFSRHGWRAGEAVVSPARVESGYRQELPNTGLKPVQAVAEFARGKIKATQPLPADTLVAVLELEGEHGLEHWMGLHNFYVITRYNHSAMYALSVFQLSQEIGSRLP